MQLSTHHIRRDLNDRGYIDVSTRSAGWKYLSFQVRRLAPGERMNYQTEATEAALVPIEGTAAVQVAGESFRLARTALFTSPAQVLYAPPGVTIAIQAETAFEVAI